MPTLLSSLPDDVLLRVFAFLEISDILALRKVRSGSWFSARSDQDFTDVFQLAQSYDPQACVVTGLAASHSVQCCPAATHQATSGALQHTAGDFGETAERHATLHGIRRCAQHCRQARSQALRHMGANHSRSLGARGGLRLDKQRTVTLACQLSSI